MSEHTTQDLLDRIGAAGAPEVPFHPDVALWRTATRDDIDAIHSVHAAADAVDHPTWITPRVDIADTFDYSHIDPGRDTVIGFEAGGRALAFSRRSCIRRARAR